SCRPREPASAGPAEAPPPAAPGAPLARRYRRTGLGSRGHPDLAGNRRPRARLPRGNVLSRHVEVRGEARGGGARPAHGRSRSPPGRSRSDRGSAARAAVGALAANGLAGGATEAADRRRARGGRRGDRTALPPSGGGRVTAAILSLNRRTFAS